NNAFTVLVEGRTGIGIDGEENDAKPTEMLDIGKGRVKIRDLPVTSGTNTQKIVVVDGDGVLRSIDPDGGSISDRRLKQDLKPLFNTLPLLDSIQAYSYRFRRDRFPDKNLPRGKQIVLLAQELEKYFPELISIDKEGYKSIRYQQFTAVLLNAVKVQQAQIKDIQEGYRLLLKRVQQLERDRAGHQE